MGTTKLPNVKKIFFTYPSQKVSQLTKNLKIRSFIGKNKFYTRLNFSGNALSQNRLQRNFSLASKKSVADITSLPQLVSLLFGYAF